MISPEVARRSLAKEKPYGPHQGVPSAQAGLYLKIAYHLTRRAIAGLTGPQTERMIEPLEMYAHVPVLLKGYAKLEQATAKLHRLDKKLHALAERNAATLTTANTASTWARPSPASGA